MSVHEEVKLLLCSLSCPFSSKLHKQGRLTLVHSFFLERSGVQVSICENDASEVHVLADWLIAKQKRLAKFALGPINAVVRANKTLFAFALYLNGSSTKN